MSHDAPKSALEIALERLRRKDEESGTAAVPLTEVQRSAIAEARQICDAKLAEREILHASRMAGVFDPAERAQLEDGHRRERERLLSDRDGAIARIRAGTESSTP